MPGVRLSATPRGLRMGLGPRAARIHVGSGRPTISTGKGPATVWTGIGPRHHSGRPTRQRPAPPSPSSPITAVDRADQARRLAAFETAVVSVHKGPFPPAEPKVADPPPPVDEPAIRRRAKGEALAGISMFAFGKRAEAKQHARGVADERIREAHEARARAQAAEQAHLDEEWRLLRANDPATVLQALEAAFEDNQAPAVPVDCTNDSVGVVMLYPSAHQIPAEKAAITPTGRPTVHKRSQTDRNALHVQGMASHILATVRETFAIAPMIHRVLVLTVEKSDAVGGISMLRPIAATGFDRATVERFNWARLDPLATVEAANPSLMDRRGRTGELAALDLSDEPDTATVLVTCAAILHAQVDPRVRIPPGTMPHVPADDESRAAVEPTPDPVPSTATAPLDAPAPPTASTPGAWLRFRASRWWVQVIAWLLVSPVLASWWCWRRPWPVWGRLVAIGLIAFASLAFAGSFGGSNASKNTGAPPPTTSAATTSGASTRSATTSPTTHKRKPKPHIQARAATGVFNPLEQDGFRDAVRVSFRTPTADADSIRVINARGRVVQTAELGRLSANHVHTWRWDGRTSSGGLASPGRYEIRVIGRHAGHGTAAQPIFVSLRPLSPRVGHVGVSPSPFYPIEHDGYRDTATITFTTNTTARDTIHIRGPGGRVIRSVALGALTAHSQHSWSWDGRNNAGESQSPGTYQVQIRAAYYDLHAASPWRSVTIKRKSTTPSNCTPGYSPCLVDHGGADYDCAGGSGNGPYYTEPGVEYTVTGSDPYGLDANGNGLGCES